MPNLTVRTDPSTLRRPADGDDAIALLIDAHERDLVEEARLIVQADEDDAATCEHLRVLLRWLDSGPPEGWRPAAPDFDEDLPF